MSSIWFSRYENGCFRQDSEKELADSVDRWRNGTGHLGRIVHQYFEKLMYKCRNSKRRVYGEDYGLPADATILDALQNDAFLDTVFKFIYTHPKMFYASKSAKPVLKTSQDTDFTKDDFDRMKLYFRMGPDARKVSAFPPKNVKQLIVRLFPDRWITDPLNYHDPSCGFGTRAAAGLLQGCSYYGTDPNRELCGKIEEMVAFLRKVSPGLPKSDIRCQGSEVFIPEWEGIMDLSFTSPPYFNLEVYSADGYASTRNYSNYEKWLEEFLYPSIRNSMAYLKPDGYFCLNIKNLPGGGKPIWDDAFKFVAQAENFEMLEPIDFVPESKRAYVVTRKDGVSFVSGDNKDAKEQIMVARKKA